MSGETNAGATLRGDVEINRAGTWVKVTDSIIDRRPCGGLASRSIRKLSERTSRRYVRRWRVLGEFRPPVIVSTAASPSFGESSEAKLYLPGCLVASTSSRRKPQFREGSHSLN
jgi:hypothetical protein